MAKAGEEVSATWRAGWLLLGLLVLTCHITITEGRHAGTVCEGGRSLGDKWFDGCHWCVCTSRGVQCSRSHCSSLVQQVAPCHVIGQKWTDGCYRCRCKRQGIACRLDVTCLLLRHHPVPCLADDRCICGPDGVPSCTAEVIDRHAFAARRVDLGIPALLMAEVQHHSPRMPAGDHHLEKLLETASAFEDLEQDLGSTSQELLITSDNLCRFGPRWYGGSLRCFCDMDGAITCGNPSVVSAFFDDFKVRREECEEGHAWEDGCSVCTCRLNGVVFCRRDRHCRHRYFDDENDDKGIDHYLPGLFEPLPSEPSSSTWLAGPTYTPTTKTQGPRTKADTFRTRTSTAKATPSLLPRVKSTAGTSRMACLPGSHWRDGCQHCHCNDHARAVCNRRHCKGRDEVKDVLKTESSQVSPKHHRDNVAVQRPVTMSRGPRGPMMMAPRPPPSLFRPPAYSKPAAHSKTCGKFRVGQMYWDDCNLCLCTSRGPKCQGKQCR